MHQIESWAQALSKSIQGVSDQDLKIAVEGGWLEDSKFHVVASAIVEPSGIDDDYGVWMEADIGNWAQWIKTTLGEDWGKIAYIVAVEGY